MFLLGIWRGSSATIINDNFYSLTPFEFNFFFILRKSIKKILPNIFRKFNRNNVVMINVHGKCDTFEIANGIVNPIEYINHCSRLSFPLKWMKNSKIFFFVLNHTETHAQTHTHTKKPHTFRSNEFIWFEFGAFGGEHIFYFCDVANFSLMRLRSCFGSVSVQTISHIRIENIGPERSQLTVHNFTFMSSIRTDCSSTKNTQLKICSIFAAIAPSMRTANFYSHVLNQTINLPYTANIWANAQHFIKLLAKFFADTEICILKLNRIYFGTWLKWAWNIQLKSHKW